LKWNETYKRVIRILQQFYEIISSSW
jgi:hypothetical protein